jgi:hypothetical protein
VSPPPTGVLHKPPANPTPDVTLSQIRASDSADTPTRSLSGHFRLGWRPHRVRYATPYLPRGSAERARDPHPRNSRMRSPWSLCTSRLTARSFSTRFNDGIAVRKRRPVTALNRSRSSWVGRKRCSSAHCQWPSVSPQLRPSFLPTGGHVFPPLVATNLPTIRTLVCSVLGQGSHSFAGGRLREAVAV